MDLNHLANGRALLTKSQPSTLWESACMP